MKDIPRLRGRKFISQLVTQGEHSTQDFKFAISDARKIARSISAFANAEGGHLLIGVKDNGVVAGVRNEEDIFVVEQAASRYCRPKIEVEFTAYSYDTNVVVIRAAIPRAKSRPVRCQEADGKWRAYYRVNDENIVAHHLMVRSWTANSSDFALTTVTAQLIGFLESKPTGAEIDEITHSLGISRRTAENLVVQLASAGVVGFAYYAPRFRIIRLSQEQ